jgi:hypothetical protein
MKKRTHLTIVDAQIAVNQQQIVATEDDRVSYFAHPALGSRRMKGGFSVVKNSGQIILDDMVEQVSLLISFYYSQSSAFGYQRTNSEWTSTSCQVCV